MNNTFSPDDIPDILNEDPKRTDLARQRQVAFWNGEKPDAWPIMFTAPLTEEQERLPESNYQEAFYDADLMLYSQLRGACAVINARSDAVPSIRANLGTAVALSCIGLKQMVFTDKMPWLQEHLTREEVSRLEPDDVKIQGDFERGTKYMRYFQEVLKKRIPAYCMDSQGPMDLAHLIAGDDIFYAFYDDPPYVHHLLEIALTVGVRAIEWMREVKGEPPDKTHHGNSLYGNIGVNICEDTSAIIGPEAIDEFSIPYDRRLAQHFGGARVHYCGRSDPLTQALCETPEIRGINFGHIPGKDDLHDFEEEMEKLRVHGKIYYGPWPRKKNESGKDYLKRLHKWSAQGILISRGNAAVAQPFVRGTGKPSDMLTNPQDAELFPDVPSALDYWYSLS